MGCPSVSTPTSDPQLLEMKGLVLPRKGPTTVGGICRARWKNREVTQASLFSTYLKTPV